MLDPRVLTERRDDIRESCRKRGVEASDLVQHTRWIDNGVAVRALDLDRVLRACDFA